MAARRARAYGCRMYAVAQRLPHAWRAGELSLLSQDSRYILPSGNQMPLLGIGTWQLRHHTEQVIAAAIEAGYRLIDTSRDYHTQRGIGDALRADGVERGSIYLVTKVEETDDAYEAVLANLAELRCEYADLVL